MLFRYDGQVIASATYQDRKRYLKPNKDGYEGGLFFDTKSIRIFSPVSSATLESVWKDFPSFSHVKRRLDPKRYPAFEAKLKNVRRPKKA